MSEPTRMLRLIVLAAIVLCIVASLTGARAEQDKNGGGLKIAVVNPGRLLAEYKYTKTSDDSLRKKQQDMLTVLQTWDQNQLLSEADQKALGDLAVKDPNALTADEKTKKQKLLDDSKRLFDEMLALQTKPQLNPAENDRLKQLTKLQSETAERIKTQQTAAQDQLQKEAATVRDKMDTDVRAAINKISKEKGCNLVFSSEVVLYGDNDLTDTVLKELNK